MNDIERQAIEYYGEDSQIDKAIEEMSELIKALLKERRAQCEIHEVTNVTEEMADVEIMMDQLKIIFNNSEQVELWKKTKLERLFHRIFGEEVSEDACKVENRPSDKQNKDKGTTMPPIKTSAENGDYKVIGDKIVCTFIVNNTDIGRAWLEYAIYIANVAMGVEV